MEDSEMIENNYYEQVQFPKLTALNQERFTNKENKIFNEISRSGEGNSLISNLK